MAEAVYDVHVRDRTRRGFDQAERQAKGFSARVSRALQAIRPPNLLVAGGAALGIAKLTGAVGDFLDRADQIDKASLRTGLGAVALQRLGFAAEQSGSSFETIERGLKTFAGALDDARFSENSPAARGLTRLGLSLEDLEGLSVEDSFARIAGALGQVSDDALQAALAADFFGRSGIELIPLAEAGEEGIRALGDQFEATGNVISQEAAAQGAAVNDAFNRIRNAISAVFTGLLVRLLPIMQRMVAIFELVVIPAIRDHLVPVFELIIGVARDIARVGWETLLKPAFEAIVSAAQTVAGAMRDLKAEVDNIFAPLVDAINNAAVPALERLRDEFGDTVESANEDIGDTSLFEALLQGVLRQVTTLLRLLSFTWTLVVRSVASGVDFARLQLRSFLNGWQVLVSGIGPLADTIAAVLRGAWSRIETAWDAAIGFFEGTWGGIERAWAAASPFVTTTLPGAFADAWDAIARAWGAAVGFFEGTWDGVQRAWDAASTLVTATIPAAFADAWDAIKGAWDAAVGFFGGVWDDVRSGWDGFEELFDDTIPGVFRGAWDSIRSAWNVVRGFFGDIWRGLRRGWDGFKSVLLDDIPHYRPSRSRACSGAVSLRSRRWRSWARPGARRCCPWSALARSWRRWCATACSLRWRITTDAIRPLLSLSVSTSRRLGSARTGGSGAVRTVGGRRSGERPVPHRD